MSGLNLIQDPWIPTDQGILTPSDALVARQLQWPRSDWNAMTYVFLTSLLQSAIVLDEDLMNTSSDWDKARDKPPESIKPALDDLAHAFDLEGPHGFMQVDVASEKPSPESSLLPGMPGANTLKKNADLFVHRDQIPSQLSWPERAISLFTLGQAGWSQGGGFLKNSRGGNAMTVLVKPLGATFLWNDVVANLLPHDAWLESFPTDEGLDRKRLWPWTDPSVRVASKNKRQADPLERGHLHALWQMPHRAQYRDEQLFTEKGGVNGGISYTDALWRHPWSAYREDNGNVKPLSLSRNQGYQHWAPYLLGSDATLHPMNVHHYLSNAGRCGLWVFGWSISQAEALTWVDQQTPAVARPETQYRPAVDKSLDVVGRWSKSLAVALRKAGLSSAGHRLYERSESAWYELLAGDLGQQELKAFSALVQRKAFTVYEEFTSAIEPMDYAKGLAVLRRQA